MFLDQETGIPGNSKLLREVNGMLTHAYYDHKRIAVNVALQFRVRGLCDKVIRYHDSSRSFSAAAVETAVSVTWD